MLVEFLDDVPEGGIRGGADDLQGVVRQGRVEVRGESDACDYAEGAASAAAEGPEKVFVPVGVCGYVGSLGFSARLDGGYDRGVGKGEAYICRDYRVLQHMIGREALPRRDHRVTAPLNIPTRNPPPCSRTRPRQ